MTRKLIAIALLIVASLATAQTPAPANPPAQAQAPAAAAPQTPPTISSVVDRQVSNYERLMTGAAEAMPAEKFDFNPASLNIPGATFKDVRTFAVLIKHTASSNFAFWSAVTGEPLPPNIKGTNGPEELKTKAEIIQFLKDSFALGHRAAKMLTAENSLENVKFVLGNQQAPRLYYATNAVIHCGDEYGQMVEYLRMNGIVPPASASR